MTTTAEAHLRPKSAEELKRDSQAIRKQVAQDLEDLNTGRESLRELISRAIFGRRKTR